MSFRLEELAVSHSNQVHPAKKPLQRQALNTDHGVGRNGGGESGAAQALAGQTKRPFSKRAWAAEPLTHRRKRRQACKNGSSVDVDGGEEASPLRRRPASPEGAVCRGLGGGAPSTRAERGGQAWRRRREWTSRRRWRPMRAHQPQSETSSCSTLVADDTSNTSLSAAQSAACCCARTAARTGSHTGHAASAQAR